MQSSGILLFKTLGSSMAIGWGRGVAPPPLPPSLKKIGEQLFSVSLVSTLVSLILFSWISIAFSNNLGQLKNLILLSEG